MLSIMVMWLHDTQSVTDCCVMIEQLLCNVGFKLVVFLSDSDLAQATDSQ